jgi:hypothetical protein
MTAVERISDQAALYRIARSDSDSEVRRSVTERITDQNVLAEIAKNDKDRWVRAEAIKKIVDNTVLLEIAKNNSDYTTRVAVVKRLTDQSELCRIAKSDSDSGLRRNATERITDQNVLSEIAKNDKDSRVRTEAIKKIMDDSVLVEIAKNEVDYDLQKTAIRQITVSKMPKNSDWSLEKAVSYITDQLLLSEIIKKDKNFRVREAAAMQLKDENVLADIVRNINDEETLALFEGNYIPSIRKAASKKLRQLTQIGQAEYKVLLERINRKEWDDRILYWLAITPAEEDRKGSPDHEFCDRTTYTSKKQVLDAYQQLRSDKAWNYCSLDRIYTEYILLTRGRQFYQQHIWIKRVGEAKWQITLEQYAL